MARKNLFKKGSTAPEGSITATNKALKVVGDRVSRPMDGLAQTYGEGMPRAMTLASDTLQQLSALAALQTLTDPQVMELHDYVSATFTKEDSAVDEIARLIRARALAIIEDKAAHADPTVNVAPTGSITLTLPNGRTKLAKVQRSGLDKKLVEAQLRAKSVRLEKYMNPVTMWELKPDAETKLVDDKVFTPDELKALHFARVLALMPSKAPKSDGGES